MDEDSPLIELVVSPSLPADDLMDAAEFVLLALSIHGMEHVSLQSPFVHTTHPHINRISNYVIKKYKDTVYKISNDERMSRAHELIEKLKQYCDVTIVTPDEEGEDISVKLMVLKTD